MGIYTGIILPKLCDLSMRHDRPRPYREQLIGVAEDESLRPKSVRALTFPFDRPARKFSHSNRPQSV